MLQRCPNCGRAHDVRVYVTGQRALCSCGIRFEVQRRDSSSAVRRTSLETALGPTLLRVGGSAPAGSASSSSAVPLEARTQLAAPMLEIPGYTLRQLLGRGGMGEVWRAEQQSLGRAVAIKVLPPKLAQDPEFVARFDKEATALASLSHPNIVQIIDRGRAGEHYYFVMEFVEGKTLRERMAQGPLRHTEVMRLGVQLCRALECAHEHHIIHRDLKPENVLVDERGHLKVADFGLVGFRRIDPAAVENEGRLTAAATAMGTLNYMAPEQRRDAATVDERADLYSIGVILYELLTGELPLGRFPPPSARRAASDPRLDAVVMRALEADPAARYAHASILGETLERLLADATTGPQRVEPKAPEPVPAGKGMGLRGVVFVAGLALVALLGVIAARRLSRPDDGHGHRGAGQLPANTDRELGVSVEASRERGEETLDVRFTPGTEVLNAHAGSWRVHQGTLKAVQAGNDSGGQPLLVPRAYLGTRYFSSDDFHAEAVVKLRELESDFPKENKPQRYAELSYRVRGLQISALAVPGVGMRAVWRYQRRDGRTTEGDSSHEVAEGISELAPFPGFGVPFRMALTLRRAGNGVQLETTVNGAVFFRRFLDGFQGQVAKAAVGCRNLHCEFPELQLRGKVAAKPGSSP